MKNSKKAILLVITLVITSLLIISPLSITAGSNNGPQIVKMDNELASLQIQKADFNYKAKQFYQILGEPEFEYPGDQLHPSIARSASTGYLAAYKDKEYGEIVWTNPLLEDGVYFDIGGDYPSLELWGGTRFFGSLVPDTNDGSGGIIYLFETTDNTDIETYNLVGWDWSDNGWSNILGLSLACDDSKEAWEWGFISMVASTTYGDGVTDGPFITYQTSEDGYATISWYIGVDGCLHTDTDIDHNTYYSYAAYDWYNPDGSRWEILIRQDNYANWDEEGAMYEYYDSGTDYTNPSIAAQEGNILCVFETNEDGNQDIRLFYGNTLETLDEKVIAGTTDDETSPDIEHLEGDSFICTYVKNGELYAIQTDDAGASWKDAWMISDGSGNVVSEYQTSDISEGALQVIWEGQGAQDIDLWLEWALDNEPPSAPIIEGPTENVEPNTMIEYDFTSTDPEGEEIDYLIDWGDGNVIGWMGSFPSGFTLKKDHFWEAEETTFNIRAKARDSNGIESEWASLQITTPKPIDQPSLVLRLLQKLIDMFPVLEPILLPLINQL